MTILRNLGTAFIPQKEGTVEYDDNLHHRVLAFVTPLVRIRPPSTVVGWFVS
jgi:hypothetical protein